MLKHSKLMAGVIVVLAVSHSSFAGEPLRVKTLYPKEGVLSSENPAQAKTVADKVAKNACFTALKDALVKTPMFSGVQCEVGTPVWQLTLFSPQRTAQTSSYKLAIICDDGNLASRDKWAKWIDEQTIVEHAGGTLAETAQLDDSKYASKFCDGEDAVELFRKSVGGGKAVAVEKAAPKKEAVQKPVEKPAAVEKVELPKKTKAEVKAEEKPVVKPTAEKAEKTIELKQESDFVDPPVSTDVMKKTDI